MKQVSFFLAVMMALYACAANDTKKNEPSGTITTESTVANPVTDVHFIDSVKNLGKIVEGEKIEMTYKFINTGDNPLIIYNVSTSCGCTIAEKPEQPVMPGKEGYIKAVFDSKGKLGTNNKFLQVYCNTPTAHYPLIFNAEVVPKSN